VGDKRTRLQKGMQKYGEQRGVWGAKQLSWVWGHGNGFERLPWLLNPLFELALAIPTMVMRKLHLVQRRWKNKSCIGAWSRMEPESSDSDRPMGCDVNAGPRNSCSGFELTILARTYAVCFQNVSTLCWCFDSEKMQLRWFKGIMGVISSLKKSKSMGFQYRVLRLLVKQATKRIHKKLKLDC
jgi:hypothetical protein